MKRIEYEDIKLKDYLALPAVLRSKAYRRVDEFGTVVYIKSSILHKNDGPCRITETGERDWRLDGTWLTETEFLKTSKLGKELLK